MKVVTGSTWNESRIESFLLENATPLRVAVNRNGFPLICSLWFVYLPASQSFFCASHKNSQLVQSLLDDDRCGFEVATNEPPYRGVRGQARVRLSQEGAEETLTNLCERFLGESNSGLKDWLFSRIDDEYVLRIEPTWISSWDYSARMD